MNETMQPGVDPLTDVLRYTHAKNLETYKQLLCNQENRNCKFWDIVVVTAGDHQQRLVYEHQIQQLQTQNRIPAQAKYHVIEDPPGSKIGSGGSTFLVMKALSNLYSHEYRLNARILLIHAGGYSTRLPHVSARGKVFMTLPQANSEHGIQILDLKLILYLHLLESMPPGIFLTSADGIELFSSKNPFPSEPKPFTITALAHPSSTWIGTTHGVYLLEDPEGRVLEDVKLAPKDQSSFLLKCKRFLHKPSLNTMKSTPGVIYSHAGEDGQDIVYTDSCYYFDPQAAEVMAKTYDKLELDCDLEAWADILCFEDQSTVISEAPPSNSHQLGRQIVKEAFQASGVVLDVMVLNASKFYHLGTMQEFLEGTCTDASFMTELNIQNQEDGVARVESTFDTLSNNGSAHIHPPAYIENSIISPMASIQTHSIIVDSDIPPNALIPENTCMFTLQIQKNEFVTFTFSVRDDMKLSPPSGVSENIQNELKIFEQVPVSVASPECPKITGSASLWTAQVFEVAGTKQESINFALNRLHRISRFITGDKNLYSILGEKDEESINPAIVDWISLKAAAKKAREFKD